MTRSSDGSGGEERGLMLIISSLVQMQEQEGWRVAPVAGGGDEGDSHFTFHSAEGGQMLPPSSRTTAPKIIRKEWKGQVP